MSRNISEVSIFGEYRQPENRLTAAFLQILKVGGEPLIREIAHRIGFAIPSSDIEIVTQSKESNTVPDGRLECNFSFCLFIESKTGKLTYSEQLDNNLQLIEIEQSRTLLYLTGDEARPEKLPPQIHWSDWEGTLSGFREYLQNTTIENRELLSFLIDQYEILLNNTVYKKKKWSQSKDKVIIVAGSGAEGVAVAYGYYICQNRRQFQSSEYIAFYKNNAISRLFRIIDEPKDDVDLRDIADLKEYLLRERPQYDGEKQRIFRLEKVQEVGPIINDSLDKNGKPCPFTYGQPRYTTLERIKSARRTSEL